MSQIAVTVSRDSDGKLMAHFVPVSGEPNRDRLMEEFRLLASRPEAAKEPITWTHNGVRLDTEMANRPEGLWARFTELNAEIAS
jgi:hypothetical protein